MAAVPRAVLNTHVNRTTGRLALNDVRTLLSFLLLLPSPSFFLFFCFLAFFPSRSFPTHSVPRSNRFHLIPRVTGVACRRAAACWCAGSMFSNVNMTSITTDCTKGSIAGLPGTHAPPPPPAPRGDKPNIVFLVVESTDGRTWSKGYQDGVVPLPNIRKLQDGGLEFHRHYSNVPVCCPSRASFWSGRHAHHIPHPHNGVAVGGAWNNYEGLPLNYTNRIDQVMEREGYSVQVAGKTDWNTGGHSENVRLDAWTMYTDYPYNIPASGGWKEEDGACASSGSVRPGDAPWQPDGSGTTAHGGDWNTAAKTVQWIKDQAAAPGNEPWFAFQGMDIVHPPYATSSYWYNKIDVSKIELPPWAPLVRHNPPAFCELEDPAWVPRIP